MQQFNPLSGLRCGGVRLPPIELGVTNISPFGLSATGNEVIGSFLTPKEFTIDGLQRNWR